MHDKQIIIITQIRKSASGKFKNIYFFVFIAHRKRGRSQRRCMDAAKEDEESVGLTEEDAQGADDPLLTQKKT